MSRVHPVFNVVKLTPASEDPTPRRRAVPPPLAPPEIVDGEEEWVVEEILDSKMMNRKLRYLVRWKDFGMEHNSWELWDNVHAPDLVAEFYRKHPGAARHIQTTEFLSIPFRPTTDGPFVHLPSCPSFPFLRHLRLSGMDLRFSLLTIIIHLYLIRLSALLIPLLFPLLAFPLLFIISTNSIVSIYISSHLSRTLSLSLRISC
jgi:hypothetical protein